MSILSKFLFLFIAHHSKRISCMKFTRIISCWLCSGRLILFWCWWKMRMGLIMIWIIGLSLGKFWNIRISCYLSFAMRLSTFGMLCWTCHQNHNFSLYYRACLQIIFPKLTSFGRFISALLTPLFGTFCSFLFQTFLLLYLVVNLSIVLD